MKIIAETPRLVLREILPSDEQAMFELDADPDVHRYLGNNPIKSLEEARQQIDLIRRQYQEDGVGRWAVIEKQTNSFTGWSGLKLIRETRNNHSNYYDLGYRFIRRYWNQGYAGEAARAVVDYALHTLNLREIYGMADVRNLASRKVLEKAGLSYVETFDFRGDPHFWLRITSG